MIKSWNRIYPNKRKKYEKLMTGKECSLEQYCHEVDKVTKSGILLSKKK